MPCLITSTQSPNFLHACIQKLIPSLSPHCHTQKKVLQNSVYIADSLPIIQTKIVDNSVYIIGHPLAPHILVSPALYTRLKTKLTPSITPISILHSYALSLPSFHLHNNYHHTIQLNSFHPNLHLVEAFTNPSQAQASIHATKIRQSNSSISSFILTSSFWYSLENFFTTIHALKNRARMGKNVGILYPNSFLMQFSFIPSPPPSLSMLPLSPQIISSPFQEQEDLPKLLRWGFLPCEGPVLKNKGEGSGLATSNDDVTSSLTLFLSTSLLFFFF